MTDKDKRLILEFCGFKYSPLACDCSTCSVMTWIDPYAKLFSDGKPTHTTEPDLDSNFYFEFAVPKLRFFSLFYGRKLGYLLTIEIDEEMVTIQDNNPAEAFGQALLKLIRED